MKMMTGLRFLCCRSSTATSIPGLVLVVISKTPLPTGSNLACSETTLCIGMAPSASRKARVSIIFPNCLSPLSLGRMVVRAEEHTTTKHLNEATSIDIEVSFADHHEVMRILEDVIVKTYAYVYRSCPDQLANLEIPDFAVPKAPFPRPCLPVSMPLLVMAR